MGVVLAAELAPPPPGLLPEVRALGPEKVVPIAVKRHEGAGFALQHFASKGARPVEVGREPLGQQHRAAKGARAEQSAQSARDRGAVLRCADGPKLVSGSVSYESQELHRALASEVERQKGDDAALVVATGMKQRLAVSAEVTPPCLGPFTSREDASAAPSELVPIGRDESGIRNELGAEVPVILGHRRHTVPGP